MRRGAKRLFWTSDEVQTLKAHYPDTPTWELAERLGRPVRSLYGKAQELGLKKSPEFLNSPMSGRTRAGSKRGGATRFKPGDVPHNKGQKGWNSGGRSEVSRFMPGHRPHNWVPVGSERLKDGVRQRKVTDTGCPPRDWKAVHRIVWEEHNGPTPPGHIVSFRNGNRQDIRIENLELISRAENMRRNSLLNLPEPLPQLIQLRGAINRQINKRRKQSEKQD
jgi:hypothetical protein